MSAPTVAVLHALVPSSRQTTIDHVLCYLRYLRAARILYHHVRQPPGRLLRLGPIDLVLVNYCFLAQRTTDDWSHFRDVYGPVINGLECPVVALPQDDFNAYALLDDWLSELGVTEIWSPIEENIEVLYPKSIRTIPFRRQLTGYVDERQASIADRLPAIAERPIDLGTRVRFSPPSLGRYAQLKGRQALGLRDRLADVFRVDISTDPADSLLGGHWFDFLASCRFTVGRKGGASVANPDNTITRRAREFVAQNPQASFQEVEAACFPDADGRCRFTAVSPRLFEAAVTRTCQLLAPDDYLGVLVPWVHYVPLEEDFSNLDEVVDVMRDVCQAQEIADACYDELVGSGRYSYASFAQSVTSRHLTDDRVGTRTAERVADPLTDVMMKLPEQLGVEALDALRQVMKVVRRRGALDAFRAAVRLASDHHARGLELGGERIVTRIPALAEAGHAAPVAGELATIAASVGASETLLAWIDCAAREQVGFGEELRWVDPSVFRAPDETWQEHVVSLER